jgi:hypothetical protein
MSDGKPIQNYEVRVRGRLGDTVRLAFADFRVHIRGGDTVITGAVTDQAALHGLLVRIESLGLELLEVRQLRER